MRRMPNNNDDDDDNDNDNNKDNDSDSNSNSINNNNNNQGPQFSVEKFDKFRVYLVNSAEHRGKADEKIRGSPRLHSYISAA